MNPQDLEEYLNKIIKPALEEYAKENNISIEDLLLQLTSEKNSKSSNDKKQTSSRKKS